MNQTAYQVRPLFAVMVLGLLVADSSLGRADNTADAGVPADGGSLLERFLRAEESVSTKPSAFLPSSCDALAEQEAKKDCLITLREYYSYQRNGYQYRMSVFQWQLWSSKVIFAVVIILVLTGIVFSGIQFRRSMKGTAVVVHRKGKHIEQTKDNPGLAAESAVTTFKAGPEGFEVSSSILGVIILVISIAFFYLYLTVVYPVHDSF